MYIKYSKLSLDDIISTILIYQYYQNNFMGNNIDNKATKAIILRAESSSSSIYF